MLKHPITLLFKKKNFQWNFIQSKTQVPKMDNKVICDLKSFTLILFYSSHVTFLWLLLRIFSLLPVLNNLILMCFYVVFFLFLVLGFLGFVGFNLYQIWKKNSAIISLNIFWSHHTPSLYFGDSSYIRVRSLEVFTNSLELCSFYFQSFFFALYVLLQIISNAISSSLLIFFIISV